MPAAVFLRALPVLLLAAGVMALARAAGFAEPVGVLFATAASAVALLGR